MSDPFLANNNFPSLPDKASSGGGRGPGIPMRRVFLTDPKDPLLPTKIAAGILGKSEEALKKWRSRSVGPRYIRFHDGTIRYRLSDLLKYLDDHTVNPQQ